VILILCDFEKSKFEIFFFEKTGKYLCRVPVCVGDRWIDGLIGRKKRKRTETDIVMRGRVSPESKLRLRRDDDGDYDYDTTAATAAITRRHTTSGVRQQTFRAARRRRGVTCCYAARPTVQRR